MSGRIWIKRGVAGNLAPPAAKALGKVAMLFHEQGQDMFVTSKREGEHQTVSLHYEGHAFDIYSMEGIVRNIMGLNWSAVVSLEAIKARAGPSFDVVKKGDIFHVEYDP